MVLQGYLWPPPKPPHKATLPETIGLYAGAAATAGLDKDVDVFLKAEEERKAQFPSAWGDLGSALTTAAYGANVFELVQAEREEQARKDNPDELIPMGWAEKPFHLQLLLNPRGGSVQQVILSDFQQADREGRAVVDRDGKPRPLHLIPGVV